MPWSFTGGFMCSPRWDSRPVVCRVAIFDVPLVGIGRRVLDKRLVVGALHRQQKLDCTLSRVGVILAPRFLQVDEVDANLYVEGALFVVEVHLKNFHLFVFGPTTTVGTRLGSQFPSVG